MAGQASLAQPWVVMSGQTPVAMSWSTARSSVTATPWPSMIDRLRLISPWVWLGSGERLRVQFTYSARRPSNRHPPSPLPSARSSGLLPDRVGQAVDLVEVGHGGVEDQLVDAQLLEGGGPLPDRRRGAGRAAGDPLGPVAQEAVVAAQVPQRLLGVLLAQGEVGQGGDPRPPGPAGLLVGLPELLDGVPGQLRRGAPKGEAGLPAGGPRRRQVGLAADQQRDAAPGGRRAHRNGLPATGSP